MSVGVRTVVTQFVTHAGHHDHVMPARVATRKDLTPMGPNSASRPLNNSDMPEPLHGLNVIQADNITFLLAVVSGGTVVHLASEKQDGGREAVPEFWLSDEGDVPTIRNYDRATLVERRWSSTTLCGRAWAGMIGGDGGSLSRDRDDVAFAPSCKRCLALMDRHFPQPPQHDRLGLVAQVAADLVREYGYAEVHHVPGDQQAALRKAVRALVREQSGHASTTLVRNASVYVICDAISEQRRDEDMRAAMERVGQALLGDRDYLPAPKPEWRISWDTWASGE